MVVVPANTHLGGALHTCVPVLDQTGDRNGLPTVWGPEDTITDEAGAMPSCQGCHFTLVGSLSPRHCLLKEALNMNSAAKGVLSHKNTPPLHWGIQTAGPGGPFWSLDIMIEATVVVNIKVKLSSSVASSVWDSRKLEIIVGFLRAVFSERGPQHAAI